MSAYNDNGEKHGPWEIYHDNGNPWYKVNYIRGNEHGPWEIYHSNGELNIKQYIL